MGHSTTAVMNMMQAEERKPVEWLLIYSIERNGGIDDVWLKASGMNRAEAQRLLSENPQIQQQARDLQRIGRLFNLQMMFDLLRSRAAEMLAMATKPAEIRSLLGTLNMLRGGQLRETKEQARLEGLRNRNGKSANGVVRA